MRIQLTSVRLHLLVAVTLILSLVALVPARLMGQHRVDRTGDSVLVATGIAVQQLGQLRDAQVMFADGDLVGSGSRARASAHVGLAAYHSPY